MDEMTKPRFEKRETGFFFALMAARAASRIIKKSRAGFWPL